MSMGGYAAVAGYLTQQPAVATSLARIPTIVNKPFSLGLVALLAGRALRSRHMQMAGAAGVIAGAYQFGVAGFALEGEYGELDADEVVLRGMYDDGPMAEEEEPDV